MATGSQKVKTPSGWNSTQGGWVKTGSTTWKAVDQIYVKTPTGWNAASGQQSVQQPYPYIANSQTPYIANRQNPYPYIANAQTPYIANAQNPYPYIANAQSPYIADAQQPYPYIANSQTPYIANARQPSTYNHRSPFTYRNPVNGQTPYIANARTPRGYRNPVNGQTPYIANARSPRGYRNPVSAQQPNIRNRQTPFTYNARYPANAQSPSNKQSPFTYNARYPANAQSPSSKQSPFTYNARYPANAQSPSSSQSPFTYSFRSPTTYTYPDPAIWGPYPVTGGSYSDYTFFYQGFRTAGAGPTQYGSGFGSSPWSSLPDSSPYIQHKWLVQKTPLTATTASLTFSWFNKTPTTAYLGSEFSYIQIVTPAGTTNVPIGSLTGSSPTGTPGSVSFSMTVPTGNINTYTLASGQTGSIGLY